jgi:hypothetical protein
VAPDLRQRLRGRSPPPRRTLRVGPSPRRRPRVGGQAERREQIFTGIISRLACGLWAVKESGMITRLTDKIWIVEGGSGRYRTRCTSATAAASGRRGSDRAEIERLRMDWDLGVVMTHYHGTTSLPLRPPGNRVWATAGRLGSIGLSGTACVNGMGAVLRKLFLLPLPRRRRRNGVGREEIRSGRRAVVVVAPATRQHLPPLPRRRDLFLGATTCRPSARGTGTRRATSGRSAARPAAWRGSARKRTWSPTRNRSAAARSPGSWRSTCPSSTAGRRRCGNSCGSRARAGRSSRGGWYTARAGVARGSTTGSGRSFRSTSKG